MEKANQWYEDQPWIVGVNYVTSTAVNQIAMWQKSTFDPKTIDKELGWAEDLGFNTIRIFLDYLVWEADSSGFKKRFNQFLNICEKHKIRVIVTFFTNGGPGIEEQKIGLGKQPLPIPGVHNGRWPQTPGASIVNDPSKWGGLEKYVKTIIGNHKNDNRILMWGLYNEPGNHKLGANSLPLLRASFKWARSVNPSQPLTSDIWTYPDNPHRTYLNIISFLGEHSDVMTFHGYGRPETMKKFIKLLKVFKRPIICTEYMDRPKQTFQEAMPILKRNNVGAVSWGLVAGKIQTYDHWGSKKGSPEPKIWFQDILRKDGAPYDSSETEFIKQMTGVTK